MMNNDYRENEVLDMEPDDWKNAPPIEIPPAGEEDKSDKGDWSPKHNWNIVKGTLKDVVVAAVLALVLFKVVFNIALVNGSSMVPTLHNGDILIINHLLYEPDYGDIVVFKNEERGILVKRLIGMPGDTIEIKDSTVYRNGEALKEDYIVKDYFGDGELDGPVTVEDGHIFVLGDNRPDSYDSRFNGVGQVSYDLILGDVLFRLWPLSFLN